MIIHLIHTEDATIKQTFNRACPTAQRLASSTREFTGALHSKTIKKLLEIMKIGHYKINFLTY